MIIKQEQINEVDDMNEVIPLFHHIHHEDGEHEVHHCGGEHVKVDPDVDYNIEHCDCGKHAIDKQIVIGHDTDKDLELVEVEIIFEEECPEGGWHIESGVKTPKVERDNKCVVKPQQASRNSEHDTKAEAIIYRRSFGIIEIVDREDAVDGWERVVTGVVADPTNVDSYGNIIDAETIRLAALEFMEFFQNMGANHEKGPDGETVVLNDQIRILESWITREDGYINGRFVPQGAWVLTVRVVSDELWEGVLSGEFIGFSLEALCQRIPLAVAA